MSPFLSVLSLIATILEVLLIFNLIIIVHELGHFLAARWRGAVVEEFGVWFGKPLWRKKFGTVWYSLGSIPAGGFVKLPQMAPMETIEGESDTPREELRPLGPLDKSIVAVAGPLFSLLLALTLACLVYLVGKPTSQPESTTTIGSVLPGGPADLAHLKRGDKIISIDGKPVKRFLGATDSVIWNVVSSEGDQIDFLIERDGQPMHIKTGWTKEETAGWKRESLRKVMIGPQFVPEVASVVPGSAGDKAGLRVGDIVLSVDGVSIITLEQIEDVIKAGPNAPLALQVSRSTSPPAHGQESTAPRSTVSLTIPAAPPLAKKDEESRYAIDGIEWGHVSYLHPSPIEQIGDSVHMMKNMIGAVLNGVFLHKGDVKVQQFSGPVGILNMYRRILQSDDGWRMALAFSVFFNVNLAIINMLPFPVLDGGHITLAIIESVRRRPANPKALELIQTACALLLLSFILYVTWYNVSEHVPWKKKAVATPATEKPPTVSNPK